MSQVEMKPLDVPEPGSDRPLWSFGAEERRVLIVALQVGLWVLTVKHFHLLEARLLPEIAGWLLPAFLANAFLPKGARKTFFVGLTFLALLGAIGLLEGGVLIGVGLGLIGLCHLPLRFGLRIGLVLLFAIALAGVRAEWIDPPGPKDTWLALMPIFASIFMFRLIVYLYDMKHGAVKEGLVHRLAYFFMPPAICFPMFPVVDYKTFGKTWYDRRASDIYQKGIHWMFRGVTHLLFYRLIYFHVVPSPSEVDGAMRFGTYVISSYLLYTRISGEFHMIIGMLALFGFNLPESHHFFFLARNFSDVWRRINIYWRDFMGKIAFYPTYFRVKKLKTETAVALATAVAFLATWFLHAYQWFWLRGTFPLTLVDVSFWLILGLLVLISAVLQLRKSRGRRPDPKAPWSPRIALAESLQISGVFLTMSALVSYWSCATPGEWFDMLGIAADQGIFVSPGFYLFLAAFPAFGVLLHLAVHLKQRRFGRGDLEFWPKAGLVALSGGLITILGWTDFHQMLPERNARFLRSLTQDSFNQSDAELMERGYYENLLGTDRYTSHLWDLKVRRPSDWIPFAQSEFADPIDDPVLQYRIKPGAAGTFHRTPFLSNRWGMRDRDYEEIKPERTLRIALFGGSYSVGSGVEQEDAYEKLVERWLNTRHVGGDYDRYEILNCAVPGYTTVHRALIAPEMIARFRPDVVLVTFLDRDNSFTISRLVRPILRGEELPRELDDIRRRAGIDVDTPELEAIARLQPFVEEITLWSWRRIEAACAETGARPALLSIFARREGPDHAEGSRMRELAREKTSMTVLEIEGVFEGYDVRKLRVAPWDRHPNSLGHRLIARALMAALEQNDEVLGLGLHGSKNTRP